MRQAKLACEFHLASHFRRGPPMMSKTVLDLLHSLGVEDDMIMFDNFGGYIAKSPSAVGFMACRKTIDNKIKRAHIRGYAKKREVT